VQIHANHTKTAWKVKTDQVLRIVGYLPPVLFNIPNSSLPQNPSSFVGYLASGMCCHSCCTRRPPRATSSGEVAVFGAVFGEIIIFRMGEIIDKDVQN